MPFQAGQALANKEYWVAAFKRLESRNVQIDDFAYDAVEEGMVNTRHKDVYIAKKTKVKFNNKWWQFSDLQAHYNNSSNPNYIGTEEYRDQYLKLVQKYKDWGAFRVCKESEYHKVQINPMNVIKQSETKYSLIIHSIDNCRYRKPSCSLMNVLERGNQFMNCNYLIAADLKSCYHQFAINSESMYAMAVRFEGEILIPQTVFYGPSPAVKIINTLVNLLVLDAAIRYDCWSEAFIDDVMVFGNCMGIIEDLAEAGLIFSEEKMQHGVEVDYCGFRCNVATKEIEVLPKTYAKIQELTETRIFTNEQDRCFIEFEKLQQLCGIVVHASRTSPTGLSKAYYLLKRLAESSEEPESMVELQEEEQREITWWSNNRQIMKMRFMKTTGATIQLLQQNPYTSKPEIKDCSDASSKYFCVKINGVAYCDNFPEDIKDEIIQVKELFGAKFAVFKMDDNSELDLSMDSTLAVHNFNNKRSKNEKANEIIKEIMAEMDRGNKIVRLRWICTEDMSTAPGADRLSRRDFKETFDSHTLTTTGVNLVENTFGKVKVDVFSSPTNNVFETSYCSAYVVIDDPNNLRECGLSFLTTRELHGVLWCFPPDDLAMKVARIVGSLRWGRIKNKVKILILVREKRVKDVWSNLWHIDKDVNLEWSSFQKAFKKPTNVNMKLKDGVVLFAVGNYSKK